MPFAGEISVNVASTGYGSIDQGVEVGYLAGTCFVTGGAVRYIQGDTDAPFVNIYASLDGDPVLNEGFPLPWQADGEWHEAGQSFSIEGDVDYFAVSFSSGTPDLQSLSFDDVYLRVTECP